MLRTFPIRWFIFIALFLSAVFAGWLRTGANSDAALRVGFFPNITHAQAIIAQQMTIEGDNFFSKNLPEDLTIAWYPFNAGPSAMEALIIGTIEISYVGPNPALNAYTRAKGREIRQLAGSAKGGSALVVQQNDTARSPKDFIGKKIATPQFGNTQDVACRVWLIKGGLNITVTGGDAQVIPTQNPEMVQIFGQKEIDAAWTVEPWVSRLRRDFNGGVILEQPDEITTILVASERTLRQRSEVAGAFVKAHRALTEWMRENPDAAIGFLHRGLERITQSKMDLELIASAFKRIHYTDAVDKNATAQFVNDAYGIGMLAEKPDLERFFQHAENP